MRHIWYKTLDAQNKTDLEMIPSKLDLVSSLCFDKNKRIIGMIGSYRDDLLLAGNSKFKKLCQITH